MKTLLHITTLAIGGLVMLASIFPNTKSYQATFWIRVFIFCVGALLFLAYWR